MKDHIINEIICVEGGYVNDPRDSGRETNWGVTVAVAKAHGYNGDMRDMPRSVAFDIYSAKYWDAVRGDDLADLSEAVAEEVVDTSVNVGPGRAGKFLQRALNVLGDCGLKVDGAIGPATMASLRKYMSKRDDEETLCKALNCLQGSYYIRLAERREKDRAFIYGWLKKRVKL